jgi:hypothetical protein
MMQIETHVDRFVRNCWYVAGWADEISADNVLFLLVPAVYVAALWLEDQTGSADLVMVIPPSPKDLTPFSPLPVPLFLESLTPLAALVPQEDRKAKRPSGG